MARYSVMDESFEEIELFGKPAMFTPIRIDRNSVPRGLYLYEIRHDDDGFGDPVQIARGILVNHFGTVITRDRLKLPADGYLDMEPEDINFSCGDCRTIKAYMEKYPPQKTKNRDYER